MKKQFVEPVLRPVWFSGEMLLASDGNSPVGVYYKNPDWFGKKE